MTKKDKVEKKIALSAKGENTIDGFERRQRDVREKIAPDGINTEPDSYFILNDEGRDVFSICMYVSELPKTLTFAITFAGLFSFPGVTSNVFIEPMSKSAAQKIVDKRVRNLTGRAEEVKNNTNERRRVQEKLLKAVRWAKEIEGGGNGLYKVQFLFVLQSDSEENLLRMMSDFYNEGKRVSVELSTCYHIHPEAFTSAYTLNKVHAVQGKADKVFKTHILDKRALSTLFNHTSNTFIHRNGVFAGHYLNTEQAFLYDPFDDSHDGYGVVFAGSTGVGKSATIKMLQSRMNSVNGMRFRTLDVDSRFVRGEYAALATERGGVHFEIKPNSKNILNPYELREEYDYDEELDVEIPALRLSEKLAYLENLYISMITIDGSTMDVELEKAVRRIITGINAQMYEERGIYDMQADSLYTEKNEGGLLSSGRTVKSMPTIGEAFRKLLLKRKTNKNVLHERAYQLLIDTVSTYVNETCFGSESARIFTKEEYQGISMNEDGERIAPLPNGGEEVVERIVGSRPYFDGETTMRADSGTPFIDYDISRLSREEQAFAMLVVLGFMEANDIRTNSVNPRTALPLVVLNDELHRLFLYEAARKIIVAFYRQARKRRVSPWAATQSLKDFSMYEETEAILKNSDTLFIFRHDPLDREYLQNNTELSDSQIEKIFSLGVDPSDTDVTEEEKARHRGEVCVVDKKRVAFVKIDYLRETEASFVETNVKQIAADMEKRRVAAG